MGLRTGLDKMVEGKISSFLQMTDHACRETGRLTTTQTVNIKTEDVKSCHDPQKGLDTKTNWLTVRRDVTWTWSLLSLAINSCRLDPNQSLIN